MNRLLRAFVWICVLGMNVLILANAASATEPLDPRLEKILADWQKRQNAVESIDYQVEGELKVPKGAYTKLRAVTIRTKKTEIRVAPEEDMSGPVGLNLLLDFANERFRLEKRDQSFHFNSCKLIQDVIIYTFDGKEIKSLKPREKNPTMSPKAPDMGIVSGNVKNFFFLMDCKPIFFAHGRIYTPTEQIVPGQMRNKPDLNSLHIHGTAVHEGRSCLIVRTQTFQMGGNIGFEEYWVDLERDGTIVRYGSYSGKKLTCDQDMVIHYNMHQTDGWFPSDWRWTVFDHGKILYYRDVRVTKMKINPVMSDADFAIESHTGMIIQEVKRHPSTDPFAEPKSDITTYRQEENGKRTYLPDPFGNPGDQYNKNQPRHNLMPWFFVATVAMLIALWIWVRYRSKKKRSLADRR